MAPRTKAVVFHGDSTLRATEPLYTDAKRTFQRLVDRAGISPKITLASLACIDVKNAEKYGFSKEGFSLAEVRTLERAK